MTVQPEPRFTHRLAWPNKATMCRVPEHQAVCLLDLDILFLADPSPMFAETARDGAVRSRQDLLVPLNPWERLPDGWGRRLRDGPGMGIWRAQYRRFGGRPAPEVMRPGGGTAPLYLNNGVNFIPGARLHALGGAWERIARAMLRDLAWRRPYTFFFIPYFLDQVTYALALHQLALPWQPLPATHNFIPCEPAPAEELALAGGEDVVMAHIVSPVRGWLDPGCRIEPPEAVRPLFQRVRALVRELDACR